MALYDIFYDEWFNNPSWWFDKKKEYDDYITQKYGELLNIEIELNTNKLILVQIIIFDQLSRHIYRYEQGKHIIEYYLQKSLNLVNNYIDDNTFIDSLTDQELIFLLLPLRHSHDINNIKKSLNISWSRIETTSNKEFMKKFINATYSNINTTNQKLLICKREDNYDFEIFRNILENYDKEVIADKFLYNIKGNFEIIPENFIISLSGGVDSMVTSYILQKLRPDQNINALMINYCNRDESSKEVEFVSTWCKLLNINLYVREIKEINRPKCMKYELRNIYESYTKNVRFNSYRELWRMLEYNGLPNIILGHNKDDMFENILTNITAQTKYENLAGMNMVSCIDNIIFLRPLLNVYKNDIITYAKVHHINNLVNSTPTWSMRGQIRNNIIPVLSQWNNNSINGIFAIADHMKEMNMILENNVEKVYKKLIVNGKLILGEIDYDEISTYNLFWKLLLSKILKNNNEWIANKSFNYLIERIKFVKHKLDTSTKDCKNINDRIGKIQVPLNKNIMLTLLLDKQKKCIINITL